MPKSILFDSIDGSPVWDEAMFDEVESKIILISSQGNSPAWAEQELAFWYLYACLPKTIEWGEIEIIYDPIDKQVMRFADTCKGLSQDDIIKSGDWIGEFDAARLFEREDFEPVGLTNNILSCNLANLVPLERLKAVVEMYNPKILPFPVRWESWQHGETTNLITLYEVLLSDGEQFQVATLDLERCELEVTRDRYFANPGNVPWSSWKEVYGIELDLIQTQKLYPTFYHED